MSNNKRLGWLRKNGERMLEGDRRSERGSESEYSTRQTCDIQITNVLMPRFAVRNLKALRICSQGRKEGQTFRPDAENVGQLDSTREMDKRDLMARTKQRQGKREMAQKDAKEKVKWVGRASLSDGCNVHRNQVIQKELNLHEVRKMIRVGKRLGIEIQGNEKEVESRLGLGGLLKKKEVGKLVKVERLDFLFLQETILEEVDGDLCRMLWNSEGWFRDAGFA
ncbi:hypothetical protein SLEP1_g41678 [Rubroshorea leprosula]|uniref:Uncharacterized protein n=1 Tax=Rubroshorea leprosula TaxID=152421 RepID=A0AAV5L7D3_9ROSI|nr:hypothetical protein SLEP1_g41678 [Rubroshorea leprosula]